MNLGLGRRYTEVVYDDEDEDDSDADSDADSDGEDGVGDDDGGGDEVGGLSLDLVHGPIELVEDEVDVTDEGVLSEGLGLVTNGSTWQDAMERRRQMLWRYRAELLMTQVRLDMTRVEQVTIAGEITRLELALIMNFRDTLPEPGANWDMTRRMWEIERRLTWLRWVQLEREKEYGGVKGVWNWLKGNDRVTGRELYQRMLLEAEQTKGDSVGLLELDVEGGFGGLSGKALGGGPR